MLKYPATVDRNKVAANIADLQRQGWPRNFAIVEAMNAARASWFRKHPKGFCPLWMAYPKEHREKSRYTKKGEPILLTYTQAAQTPVYYNPSPRPGVKQGKRLLAAFTGHPATWTQSVKTPPFVTGVDIGKVIGIIYATTRDGVAENYIHKFKASSRPLLVVSPDGREFRSFGGNFRFTERGFVDE